jgi:hypothetical protein
MKKYTAGLLCLAVLAGCSSGAATHQSTNTASSTETSPYWDNAETEVDPDKKVTITNPLTMKTKELDMDGYKWLNDENPAFEQITMEESLRLYEEGGSGLVFYSYDTCPWCNRAVPVLDKAAKEMGVTIYYVDVYEPEVISDKEKGTKLINRMMADLDSILHHEKDENGNLQPAFYTPELVAVKKGSIVGHKTSIADDFTTAGTKTTDEDQMTEAQKNELLKIYEDLIQAAAD